LLTIRVKGKHIVLTALVLLLIASAVYAAAPGLLYRKADALAAAGKAAEAQSYYELIARRYPRSGEAAKALYFSAQYAAGNGGSAPGLLYIFPNGTGLSGEPRTEDDLNRAIEQLRLLRERYPESPWAKHALYELGKAYYASGDEVNAIRYLNESIDAKSVQAADSTILLARIYRTRREYQTAIALLDRSLAEQPNLNPLEIRYQKALALLESGNLDAAAAARYRWSR
jgi:outer membrane protein assembly factor BamD (BamD/ComL family)